MAFHFCAHSWEVRDVAEGTVISLSNRDLAPEAVAVLADELYEIACESDHPNLILDLDHIGLVGSLVVAKFVILDDRLRMINGRLSLINVNPTLFDLFKHIGLNDVIDFSGP